MQTLVRKHAIKRFSIKFQTNFKQHYLLNEIQELDFQAEEEELEFEANEEVLEFEAKVFSVQNDEVDGAAVSGENDGDIGPSSSSSQSRGRFLEKLAGHQLKK